MNKKELNGRRIEPLSFAWKAKMITTTLTVHKHVYKFVINTRICLKE